jgi:hypothetical protein
MFVLLSQEPAGEKSGKLGESIPGTNGIQREVDGAVIHGGR